MDIRKTYWRFQILRNWRSNKLRLYEKENSHDAAKQSKKVKLFGATTFGVLDISNMNFVKSPCNEFELGYSLSKSYRIPDMAIDSKGIQPDYYLDKEIKQYEWIDFVNKILNQK